MTGIARLSLAPLDHPEDLRSLGDEQRRRVVACLLDIARDPERGKELVALKDHQVHRGSLAGLRSAVVAGVHEAEVRVVYRVTVDDRVQVVAIGPRRGSKVYRLADERLHPRTRPRRMRR